jgi:hypothetical protein
MCVVFESSPRSPTTPSFRNRGATARWRSYAGQGSDSRLVPISNHLAGASINSEQQPCRDLFCECLVTILKGAGALGVFLGSGRRGDLVAVFCGHQLPVWIRPLDIHCQCSGKPRDSRKLSESPALGTSALADHQSLRSRARPSKVGTAHRDVPTTRHSSLLTNHSGVRVSAAEWDELLALAQAWAWALLAA